MADNRAGSFFQGLLGELEKQRETNRKTSQVLLTEFVKQRFKAQQPLNVSELAAVLKLGQTSTGIEIGPGGQPRFVSQPAIDLPPGISQAAQQQLSQRLGVPVQQQRQPFQQQRQPAAQLQRQPIAQPQGQQIGQAQIAQMISQALNRQRAGQLGQPAAFRLPRGQVTPTAAPTALPTAQPRLPTAQLPTAQGFPQADQFRIQQVVRGGVTAKRVPTDREVEAEARRAGIRAEIISRSKGLPGESAGKLVLLQQALSDLESVEKQFFTKEGKFLRGRAATANIPGGRFPLIPEVGFGGLAREMNSKINNALEAKLRIETGAAATQEEFNRLQARFGITAFDNAQSARNKLRRLKEFMRNAIVVIDPTGKFIYRTQDNTFNKQLNAPIPEDVGLSSNEWEVVP